MPLPVDLPLPGLRAPAPLGGGGAPARPLRLTVPGGRDLSVAVLDLGLACCALEAVAARGSGPGAADPSSSREPLAVVVVAGTLTDATAPALARLLEGRPEGAAVVSFGSCASCGGPYWDSYCVTKGVDQLVEVDVHVPGCPPRPEALLDALAVLARARAEP